MNPQWQPGQPLVRSINSYLLPIAPAAQTAPQPVAVNPRVSQYTTLMQQADPAQRQQLISHLVDQYNKGNQNVAPYIQDLQAKGLMNQKGLTAQSSAPIRPYTANPVQTFGNLAYRGVNALAEGATSILPNQTAGEVMDASGRPIAAQSGHAATNADLVRTALADRLMFAGNLPGLAGREASVAGNFAQRGLQRTLQNAPQFMAGAGVQSFNNQGQPITPDQQFNKTVSNVAGGLGFAALGGVGGEVVGGLNQARQGMTVPAMTKSLPGELRPQAGTSALGGDVTGKDREFTPGTTLVPDKNGNFVPKIDQPRNEVGQYGNKLPSKPSAFSHLTEDLPAPNPHEPIEVVDAYNNVANRYNTALDHEASLSRTPAMKKANAATLADLQNVKAELYNEAIAHRANGLGKLGLSPEDFGMDTRKPGQRGSANLNGDITGGKDEKLPLAKSLHLDEPTPKAQLGDLTDTKAVGNAVGKTKAYLDRLDQALAKDPKNAQLRQRRMQLASELKDLQGAYRNPSSELDQWAKSQGVDTSASPNYLDKPAPGEDSLKGQMNQEAAKQAKVDQATQTAINAQRNAPAPYQLPGVKTAQDIARNADTARGLVLDKQKPWVYEAQRLFGKKKDYNTLTSVIDSIEHPESLAENARRLKMDVSDLRKFVTLSKGNTDFMHSLRSGTGAPVGYRENYATHIVDKSSPEDAARYEALQKERSAGNFQGRAAQDRVFNDVRELHASGFKLQNMSVADWVREYTGQEAFAAQGNALRSAIQQFDKKALAEPGSNAGRIPVVDGKRYKLLEIPGNEVMYVRPDVYEKLKGFQSYDPNLVVKGVDRANTVLKQVSLAFGGFHDLNTSIRYGAQELARGRVPNLIQLRHIFFSKGAYMKAYNDMDRSGWNELFSKANLSHMQGADIKGFNVEKLNPMNTALFDREIDMMKRFTVMREGKRLGIDPRNPNPEQLAAMRDIAAKANNWYGGINTKVLARDPHNQQIFRFLTLAPDFTEGKVRTVGAALTGRGPGGNLARAQLLGDAVALMVMAEVGKRMVSGNWNQSLSLNDVKNDVLDPHIPLPWKNKNGQSEIAKLPASPISDVFRAGTQPGHFLQSHSAAGPSTVISAIQGKNYYGQPLVDPFKNPNPSFGQNLLGAVKSKVPIPVGQWNKYQAGQVNAKDAAINTLGLRVSRDPNDPQYKETQAYFKIHDAFTKTLNPNELALFNKLNPIKKDSSGNPVFDRNVITSPSNYADLLASPDFLKKYQNYMQSQPSHDPLWDLEPSQLQAYMQTQVIGKFDPGGDSKTTSYLYNQLPQGFFDQRSAYFNSLPKTAQTASAQLPQAPQASGYVQAQMDAGNFKDPMVQQYMDQHASYINQQRVAQGLPEYAAYGQAPQQGQLANPSTPSYMLKPKTSSGGRKGSRLSKTGHKATVTHVPKPKAFKSKAVHLAKVKPIHTPKLRRIA